MAELVIAKFEVTKLTDLALKLLIAAVIHAEKNRGVRLHMMSIKSFCDLAGIRTLSNAEFSPLLRQACRASAVIDVIDTVFPERDDLPFSSWAVFSEVVVDGPNVSFAICEAAFDERLLINLHRLTAC